MQKEGSGGERGPRVVVVGAGFAGVGAARRLHQGGITDVTLLEARDLPGGRVQTVVLDDGFVELGAQYLHGETEIFQTARQEGLLRDEDSEDEAVPDTVVQYQSFTFRLPGGAAIDQRIVKHNVKVLEELLLRATTAVQDKMAGSGDVSMSMGDFLRNLYPQYMERMTGDQQTKDLMIKWLEDWTVLDRAGRMDDMSLPGIARYVYEKGSGVRQTRTGLWDVFQRLLHHALPHHRLLLNKPVRSVTWDCSLCAGDASAAINNNDPQLADSQLTRKDSTREDGSDNSQLKTGEIERSVEVQISHEPEAGTRMANSVTQVDLEQEQVRTDNGSGQALHDAVGKSEGGVSADVVNPPLSDFRVAIHCEDGEILLADHVVVTSSVGFLKEHPEFFSPQLPEKHQAAVQSTGFGNVAKVFLIWDYEDLKAWGLSAKHKADAIDQWRMRMLGSDVEGVCLLWPEGFQPEIKSARSSLRTSCGGSWYEDVCMMEFLDTSPFCLLVWVHGQAATIMESLPLSEVKDVLGELLVLFLGKLDLPPPSRVMRSKWHSDPYIRGAYSYLPTAVPLEHQDALSQPLPSYKDPLVQLAGEACSREHYSTAHGALYSGQAAARVILSHYNMAT